MSIHNSLEISLKFTYLENIFVNPEFKIKNYEI